VRDSQQKKVYDAEAAAFARDPDLVWFGSVRAAQRAANEVTRSRLWKALDGPAFVLIKATRSDAKHSMALPWRNEILLDMKQPSYQILLHELAHVALWNIDKRAADHGPEFVLILRRLIEDNMSVEQRIEFDKQLDARRAKYGLNGNTKVQNKLCNTR